MIAQENPDSLTELAALAGHRKSNLSRTLNAMSRYGLVELKQGRRAGPADPVEPSEGGRVADRSVAAIYLNTPFDNC